MKKHLLYLLLLTSIYSCKKEKQDIETASISGFQLKGIAGNFSFSDSTVLGLYPLKSCELSLLCSYTGSRSLQQYYQLNHSGIWLRIDSTVPIDSNSRYLELLSGPDEQHPMAYRALFIDNGSDGFTNERTTTATVRNDVAQIDYTDRMRGETEFILYSRWGEEVFSEKNYKYNDIFSTSIYAKNLPDGSYIARTICGRTQRHFTIAIIR